jgi:putative peptidoglycan lipid II flippase
VPLLFPGFDAVPGKTELTVALSIITWPYLIFVSTAAVVQGILNSHRIFGPSAFTPVLLNLITIGLVVIFEDWFPSPEVAFAWGFTLGGVAQLVFQLPYLRGLGLKIRPDLTFGPSVRQVLRVMLPGTFAAGIYQINVLVSQYVATLLAEGAVSGLQYSLRLQELVLGVFAVSLTTVLLPSMSEQVVKNNHEGLKDTLRFACALIAFVCVPASVGLIVVARPLVRLLFESGAFDRASTELTAHALVFHAAGIYAIAMSRIVTQVFYAFQDLRTPTLVAAGVMLVHAALAVGLSLPLAHGGIALAGGLASALNTVWLWGLLRQRIGTLGTRALAGSLGRIALATAAMAGAVAGLQALTNPMAAASRAALGGWILLEVTVGVAAFFIMARWLRCPELMELLAMLRRRRARRARMAGNSGAGGE